MSLSSHRTAVDAAVAAGFVCAAVLETLAAGGSDPVLRACLAGLTVASLVVRRTVPALAAAWFGTGMAAEAVLTESTDELSVLLACLLVAYSVGAHAPLREALLGGTALGFGVAFTIASDPSDTAANILPSVLLFVGLPFAVGVTIRRRTRRIAALTLEAEALTREAEAAVAAERRRIARELHDVVSHAVTLISVQAEAGQAVIDHDPEAARRSLASISQVSREALAELARLLGVLDAQGGGPVSEPGLALLDGLVASAREAGLAVELTQSGPPGRLTPEADRCAYRAIQEGLTNALRHTADARVRIEVTHGEEAVTASVRSVGRAHASSYGGSGRGLAGLRDRVAVLGGTFAAGPSPDGFEVHVRLPTDHVTAS